MRKVAGLMLAVATLLPIGMISAAPAGAATLLTCTKLAGTATWTPPVSYTKSVTHNVKSAATLTGCKGTKGITSGRTSFTSVGKTKQNCSQLIHSTTGSTASASIKWNNGKTSVLAKLTLKSAGTATFKISGKITGGTQTSFKNKVVTLTAVFIPKGGGCINGHTALTTANVSLKAGTKSTLG